MRVLSHFTMCIVTAPQDYARGWSQKSKSSILVPKYAKYVKNEKDARRDFEQNPYRMTFGSRTASQLMKKGDLFISEYAPPPLTKLVLFSLFCLFCVGDSLPKLASPSPTPPYAWRNKKTKKKDHLCVPRPSARPSRPAHWSTWIHGPMVILPILLWRIG